MNATPRRRMSRINSDFTAEYDGELRTIPSPKGTVTFECEIRHPPSMKGRTVYVYFQDDDLTDALRELRDAAIYARSEPMTDAHPTATVSALTKETEK